MVFYTEAERLAAEEVIKECRTAGEDVVIADVMRKYPTLKNLRKAQFYDIHDYIVGELYKPQKEEKKPKKKTIRDAKVVAITSQKGGTGKSTTASCLADGLQRKKKKVLLIDLDAQCNLSAAYGAVKPEHTIMDVLNGDVSVEDAIEKYNDMPLIASDRALYVADKKGLQATSLKKALEPIRDKYDYIVLDTPPALSVLTANALSCADYVVIPSHADLFSLQGIAELANTIKSAKKINPKLKTAGILLTQYSNRCVLNRELSQMLQDAAEKIGTKVFDTTIRDSVTVREAQMSRQSLYDYAKRAKVTDDYKKFVSEFLKEVEK